MQPKIAKFLTQRLPGDTEEPGSLVLVSTCVLQDEWKQELVQLPVRFGIQVGNVRPQPLADEPFQCNRLDWSFGEDYSRVARTGGSSRGQLGQEAGEQ